jgi:hypothetical protein
MISNFKRISLYCAAFILAISITTVGCKKDNSQDSTATVQTTTDALKATQLITNTFAMAINGNAKAQKFRNDDTPTLEERGDSCGAITIAPLDWLTYPKTVIYDFGTGCKDWDGKLKTGKLILKISKLWEPNASVQVSYDNFTEDGVKIEGTFTFTNNSTFGTTNITFVADNIKITNKEGKVLSYNVRQNYKQIAGLNNWDWTDDVYDITGDISAVLSDGQKINWVINSALKKANTCAWVQAGTGTLKINGSDISVDYGANTCDNLATVTIDGVKYEIKL